MALYTQPTLSDYNTSPPPDDGSQTTANQLKWSTIKTKLSDPLSTFAAAVDNNVAAAFAKLRKTYFVTDPQFGAVGDGATDDRAAIIAAIQYAIANAPARLVFPTATYVCSDELGEFTGANDVWIDFNGSTLDFTGMSFGVAGNSKQLLHITGSYSGTPVSLTSNATRLTYAIACTTTSLSAESFVRIYSNSEWDPDRTATKRGEISQIETIDSGTALTLHAPLADDYATTDSAAIQELTMIQRVRITDGTFLAPNSIATRNYVEGVQITLGVNCEISGMRIFDAGLVQVRLRDCVLSRVNNNHVTRAYDNTQAYGISLMDACQDCEVGNNVMRECRHAFTTNNTTSSAYGLTRRINVHDNAVFNSVFNIGSPGTSGDALDTHAGAEDIYFVNNTIYGSVGQGINVEARSCVVQGNRIYTTNAEGMTVASHGIQFQPYCTVRAGEAVITDNVLCDISGSDDVSTNTRGILVIPRGTTPSTPDIERVVITGNHVESIDEPLYILKTNHATITGNTFALRVDDSLTNLGSIAVRLDSCDHFTVTGNTVTGVLRGVSVENCGGGSVTGNTIENVYTGGSGVYGVVTDSASTAVSGNHIRFTGSTSGNSYGVWLNTGANYSTAVGNACEGYATAVQDASTSSSVANNTLAP